MNRSPRFNRESAILALFYLAIAAVIGAGVGLLFSLISPLAGVVLGALWAVVVFLYLCVYSVV